MQTARNLHSRNACWKLRKLRKKWRKSGPLLQSRTLPSLREGYFCHSIWNSPSIKKACIAYNTIAKVRLSRLLVLKRHPDSNHCSYQIARISLGHLWHRYSRNNWVPWNLWRVRGKGCTSRSKRTRLVPEMPKLPFKYSSIPLQPSWAWNLPILGAKKWGDLQWKELM